MRNRRSLYFLGFAMVMLVAGCSSNEIFESRLNGGCFATSVGSYFQSSKINYRSSSGFQRFDTLLRNEVVLLEKTFNVNPAFSFFEEPATIGPNAFATSEKLLSPYSDGTVLFGIRFINKVLWFDDGEMNVATPSDLRTVLAHEYAHIFQLKLERVWNMPTPWRELQADFLASWHTAKYLEDDRFSDFSGSALYMLGDSEFTNPQHHGTHSQRLVMGLEGYAFAKEYPNASPFQAASMAASILKQQGNRIMVHATRQWFQGKHDLIIGN